MRARGERARAVSWGAQPGPRGPRGSWWANRGGSTELLPSVRECGAVRPGLERQETPTPTGAPWQPLAIGWPRPLGPQLLCILANPPRRILHLKMKIPSHTGGHLKPEYVPRPSPPRCAAALALRTLPPPPPGIGSSYGRLPARATLAQPLGGTLGPAGGSFFRRDRVITSVYDQTF